MKKMMMKIMMKRMMIKEVFEAIYIESRIVL